MGMFIPKFNVGDTVVLASESRIMDCTFGWNEDMLEYAGMTTTITNVECGDDDDTDDEYSIEIDGSYWSWSANCFELVERPLDLPEFEAGDISALF